jgi:hypothetical protein
VRGFLLFDALGVAAFLAVAGFSVLVEKDAMVSLLFFEMARLKPLDLGAVLIRELKVALDDFFVWFKLFTRRRRS